MIGRIRQDQEHFPLPINPSSTYAKANPFRMDLVSQFTYSQLLSTVLLQSKPFADITRLSDFSQEREILFSIGSVFRIEHIQQHGNQIQIIQMTLCGENHPDLQLLYRDIERYYGPLKE